MAAKRAPRWRVVYQNSKTSWASFCIRARTYHEAKRIAQRDERLDRGRPFFVDMV